MESVFLEHSLWFSRKIEKILNHNGYNRLRPVKISDVCKSFGKRDSPEGAAVSDPNETDCKSTRSDSVECAGVIYKQDSTKRRAFNSLRGKSKKRDRRRPVVPAVLLTFDKGSHQPNAAKMDVESMLTKMIVPEEELLSFEKHQREFLHELQRKRILLDECRQSLNESVSKQYELERKLEVERRRNESTIAQLNLAINATKKLEEERQQQRNSQLQNEMQLDTAISERDALRNQIRSMQLKNVKLKRDVEDLNGKHKCHVVFQKDIEEQHSRLNSSIAHLTSLVENVKKDQERIQEMEKTVDVIHQYELAVKCLEKEREKTVKERDKIENELVMKTAELERLKELMVKYSFGQKKEDENVTEYYQKTIKELNSQIIKELEGKWQLTEALQYSNETRFKMEEQEKQLIAKIAQLEELIPVKNDVVNSSTQTEMCKEEING